MARFKVVLLLAVLTTPAFWTAEAAAQSKEDLISGTPLDPEVVYAAMQTPQVTSALVQCGAGKLSAGSATFHVSVDASGKATLTKIDPVLPPDVSGCLGGVIGALSLPASGSGVDVTFLFTFPAAAPSVGTP